MARAGVTVTGGRGVEKMLRDAAPGPWTRRALLRSAFLVQNNAASEQIIRGGVFGGTNTPPAPNRLTSRTGALRSSIAIDRRELPQYAVEVGSNLVYAPVHEFGDRPFLEPALVAEAPKFPAIFMQEWDRDMAKHHGQTSDL